MEGQQHVYLAIIVYIRPWQRIAALTAIVLFFIAKYVSKIIVIQCANNVLVASSLQATKLFAKHAMKLFHFAQLAAKTLLEAYNVFCVLQIFIHL